jgi:2-dehydro-3-deoxyphosphooctonate aldolase (KDO 8-P synthase)
MIDIIPGLSHYNSPSFFLLAGPCVVESEKITMEIAEQLTKITNKLKIPFVFKASYTKANRSKSSSFTGIGDEKALKVLRKVKESFAIPVVTDIHLPEEALMAANYVDVLQIPAFLCRQTSLLLAAGATGKPVNIKKGQFMSPESMIYAVEKVRETGNHKVLLTERGNSFGYQDLIVDFRGVPTMKAFDVPVILDCTHSLQLPNQPVGVTGGRPDLIPTLAAAGVAVGVDGLFIETHPNPNEALSDGANMLSLDKLEDLLVRLLKIREAIL